MKQIQNNKRDAPTVVGTPLRFPHPAPPLREVLGVGNGRGGGLVLGSVGERENNFCRQDVCASTTSPSSDPFWTETSASLLPPRHTMGPLRRPLAEEVNPVSEDTRFPRGGPGGGEGSGRG